MRFKINPFNWQPREDKIRTEDCQLVGAYVPRQLANQLALCALHHKISKSTLVRNCIANQLPYGVSSKNMIIALAKQAAKYWKSMIEQNEKEEGWKTKEDIQFQYEEYRASVFHILRFRSISDKHTTSILTSLDKQTEMTVIEDEI